MTPDATVTTPDPLRSPVTTLDHQLDLIRWAQSERMPRHLARLDRTSERPLLRDGRLSHDDAAAQLTTELSGQLAALTNLLGRDDAAKALERRAPGVAAALVAQLTQDDDDRLAAQACIDLMGLLWPHAGVAAVLGLVADTARPTVRPLPRPR